MSPSRYRVFGAASWHGRSFTERRQTMSVVEVLQRHEFADADRFVAEYATVCGEKPPMPAERH